MCHLLTLQVRLSPARHSYVLTVMILFVVAESCAHAQSSSEERQITLPSSVTRHDGSGNEQALAIPPGSLNRLPDTPCGLRVRDSIPQAKMTDAASMNESLAYAPLSAQCKFKIFLTSTYSPYTFLSAGFQATLDQAQGQWPHYGGGMQGWGKRFGATLADTESRRFIQTFALSAILHEDPRYFPSYRRGLVSRGWYAATRVVITRKDSGDNTFNTSEFLGALFASALQNSYYPRHDRSLVETMNRFSGALSSDAIGNLLREFTPDMKRLFRKHAPKKILRIEEKLPMPAEDRP
jgi:hypothetical protein